MDQLDQAAGVGHVTVMQEEPAAVVRILIDVLDAPGVEGAGAADEAMNLVVMGEEQLGEI